MGRDILTMGDVVRMRDRALAERRSLDTADASSRKKLGGISVSGGGLQPVPAPDSWNQRLLKFIPGEAIGLYVAIDRAIYTAGSLQTAEKKGLLALWLAIGLLSVMIFNVLYLKLIWRVVRASQIAISTTALVAYVYATGGVFQPLGWTEPTIQMVVVIIIAAFLTFFKPPEPMNTSEK
jgi:hypothetical protein